MIGSGQVLTRVTIWITIVAYTIGAATFAFSRKRTKWDSAARLAWTVACVSLLAHVASAFHYHHAWSHAVAYRETARQTYEVFGMNWGGGLYVNYALLIFWILDVIWWWLLGLDSYRRRPFLLVAVWHGFLIFIIFNGAVVFGPGLVRWIGLCLCLGLCLVWWLTARDSSNHNSSKDGVVVAGE